MNDKNFIVYQHIKPEGDIFYIGIGSIKRSKCKWKRSKHWKNTVNKYDYRIEILFEDLTELEAIQIEKYLIAYYGRKDLGLGILVNHTDGGEGTKGYKHTDEARLKISNSLKKRPVSFETRLKISESNKGKIRTPEMLKKLSESHLGKKPNQDTIHNMRLNRKNSKILLDPDTGVFYNSISDAARIYNISDETMRKKLINNKINLIVV